MSLFSLIILVGISLFWQAFLIFGLSMILLTSIELVFRKLNFELHDLFFCFFNTWVFVS